MDRDRLLWVPGWGMNRQAWGSLPEQLPASHQVLDLSAQPSRDALVQTVASGLNSETVGVGWSLGGQLLLEAAAISRPRGLVLLATTCQFVSADPAHGWPAKVLRRMSHRLQNDAAGTLADFVTAMFGKDRSGAQAYAAACLGDERWSTLALTAGLDQLAQSQLADRAGGLDVPVLWLHGAHDTICPIAAFRRTAEALAGQPHQTFYEVPDAAHALAWTHPHALAARIRPWLDSLTNA